jgi:hypothetical protein
VAQNSTLSRNTGLLSPFGKAAQENNMDIPSLIIWLIVVASGVVILLTMIRFDQTLTRRKKNTALDRRRKSVKRDFDRS